jgi:hypothetical protein
MFDWFKRRKLQKDVRSALADGQLNPNEAEALRARSKELGLEPSALGEAVAKQFESETAPIRRRIEATGRFSPDDEAQMLDVAKRYDIGNLRFSDMHWRFRQLWAAENGQPLSPRPVPATFVLRPGEDCYLTTNSDWKQMKTVKHRIGSRGHVQSIRIMKGWSYRISGMQPVYQPEEVLAPVSNGTFSITNKRFVFEGDRRSTTIHFKSLVDYQLYTDAIEIRKSRGPNEFFTLNRGDVEYSALLISHFASQ